MTRRQPLPHVDPDDYGFDLAGRDWTSFAQERVMLIGLDSLARDLYYTCLMPFANKAGDVVEASYYRFIQLMTPRREPKGGSRFPAPTKKQVSDALDRLELFGLVRLYRTESMREGVLKIRVRRWFGDVSSDFERRGIRRGGKPRAKRATAPPAL